MALTLHEKKSNNAEPGASWCWMENLPLVMIVLGQDLSVVWWNVCATNLFGCECREFAGRSLKSLHVLPEWERVESALAEIGDNGEPAVCENVRISSRTLGEVLLGIAAVRMPHTHDGAPRILVTGVDQTDRKSLIAQMAQSQKLEAIGQLAAGIAHEINTPTQYVGDNIFFLTKAFARVEDLLSSVGRLCRTAESGGDVSECIAELQSKRDAAKLEFVLEQIPRALKSAKDGTERIADIVRSMKEFSHPGVKERIPLDINHALVNTTLVARNEWKYVADLETHLDPELPKVSCLPGEINQVFLNILVNAAHAIKERVDRGELAMGTITITTRSVPGGAEIEFHDTGCGIPEDRIRRIFDPFYTTKEVGKGTGQGLAIAHNVIVDVHGGTIAVESVVGEGTSFTLTLPHAPEVDGQEEKGF